MEILYLFIVMSIIAFVLCFIFFFFQYRTKEEAKEKDALNEFDKAVEDCKVELYKALGVDKLAKKLLKITSKLKRAK